MNHLLVSPKKMDDEPLLYDGCSYTKGSVYTMVSWVVEFLIWAPKISEIYVQKLAYSKKTLISCKKKVMASQQK